MRSTSSFQLVLYSILTSRSHVNYLTCQPLCFSTLMKFIFASRTFYQGCVVGGNNKFSLLFVNYVCFSPNSPPKTNIFHFLFQPEVEPMMQMTLAEAFFAHMCIISNVPDFSSQRFKVASPFPGNISRRLYRPCTSSCKLV